MLRPASERLLSGAASEPLQRLRGHVLVSRVITPSQRPVSYTYSILTCNIVLALIHGPHQGCPNTPRLTCWSHTRRVSVAPQDGTCGRHSSTTVVPTNIWAGMGIGCGDPLLPADFTHSNSKTSITAYKTRLAAPAETVHKRSRLTSRSEPSARPDDGSCIN